MIRRLYLTSLIVLSILPLEAQEDSVKNRKLDFIGKVALRSMYTANKGQLEDFYISVAHANAGLSYQATPWLRLTTSVYGLTHFGLDGIKKLDKTTFNGPIYEGNLWNLIWFDGNTHFALPELKADLSFGDHQITLGRFLFQTPITNSEPWPFPNAHEGIRYTYQNREKGLRLQTSFSHRLATRYDAQFRSVGGSFGRGAIGFEKDGELSSYTGNVNSDFLAIVGVDWKVSSAFRLNLWNYYTDNVMNNLMIEPTWIMSNGWSTSALYIQQFKVNDGGNSDPELTYLPDDRASSLGLRLNKVLGKNLIQFNFTRVFDQGRLQLTRDWGLEPFYTFQRRTRIEGTRDVTAIMFKWQQQWTNDYGQFRWQSSVSRAWMPFPGDYEKSKYRLPSYAHLDYAFRYSPESFLKGFSVELYTAYRFLAEDIGGEYRYLINRADFFHADVILTYNF